MEKPLIVLATGNKVKAQQIKAIFKDSGFEVKTMREVGVTEVPPEPHNTISENAESKARFVYEHMKRHDAANFCVIADDTGVFINDLNGEPGAGASTWPGEAVPHDDFVLFILEKLKDTNRKGKFITCAAVVDSDEVGCLFHGELSGIFREEPCTHRQLGMPYGHLFVADGQAVTLAEMSTEDENAISHRGTAFRRALEYLSTKYRS